MFKFIIFFLVLYLAFSFYQASKVLKKQREEMQVAYEKKRETFAHISEETFDNCPDEELKEGILLHIFCKEDEDYEHLKDHLTVGERVFYTIYLMEIAMNQGKGSCYQFFNSPSATYAPYLLESYRQVDEQMAELVEKMINMVNAEQNGGVVEGDDTYQSLTLDYLDLAKSIHFDQKVIDYIRNHKEDFLN